LPGEPATVTPLYPLPVSRSVFAAGGEMEGSSLSVYKESEKRWMKAELHSHCSLDPVDYSICNYTPEELISKAAGLGYEVLAITCHNLDIGTEELSDYARSLGITLVPGMEVSTEGTRHTLVYNFQADAEDLDTLSKIRTRSREDTLVIAPHPFYPGNVCLRDLLEKNLDLFDAIESSGFHIRRGIDFNRRSEVLAQRTKKPIVGNGDIHYLWQLGLTYTWIYAEPDVRSILHAVKQGFVRVQKSPLTWFQAAAWWAASFWRYAFPINPAPYKPGLGKPVPERPSDEIEDGRCFGPAQEGMEP
jgi:predicted metal-dependent phosphoesterase TrpH